MQVHPRSQTGPLDFIAGPLYWRLALLQAPISGTYFDRLTDKIIAALRA
jgi:hypothetical protein